MRQGGENGLQCLREVQVVDMGRSLVVNANGACFPCRWALV